MRKQENLLLVIKGFILGVANVIPGVSGGTLAVVLGLYEKLLATISNFTKDIKNNIKFLMPLGIGIILAILTTSKLVTYALTNFHNQTIIFFVGLIFGGITLLMNKVKKKISFSNIGIFLLIFALVIGFSLLNGNTIDINLSNLNFFGYIKIFFIGAIASATMVIPGISGSFVLMLLGYYEGIIGTISDLTNFSNLGNNLLILIPFGIGALIGIVLIAKLITMLLKKYETKTYFAIMGFVLSSVVVILLQLKSFEFTFVNIVTCILMFLWGYFFSICIEKE